MMLITRKADKPSPFRIASRLPHIYCGHCRKRCAAYTVAVNGPNAATRSRVKFACVGVRCKRKGVVVHRTTSYDNATGY